MSNLARFPISVSAVRHPRAGFESIPRDISKAELLRYFTYSENDLREINLCRGAGNRIGFALLLSGARLTGRFPYDFELIPRSVLTHICAQMRIDPPLFVDYPQRRPTRHEHTERLKTYLGLRNFTHKDRAAVKQLVSERVRGGARLHELLPAVEQSLREQYVVLPGVTILERLIGQARSESEDVIFADLCQRLNQNERQQILKLMEAMEGQKTSRFQQLQQSAGRPSPGALERELDSLAVVGELLPSQLDLGDLHPQLLERLALTVSGAPTQTMMRYTEQKRIGLLLCWLWRLRTQLTDTALTISNDLIAGVLRRARNAAVKERQRQQKRIGQVLKTCGEVVEVLLDKSIPDAELRTTIAGYWDEEELQGLALDCQELGAGPDAIYWGELRKRYSYVRQFAPLMIERFDLRAVATNEPLLKAVDYLRERNREGKRGIDADAPTEFVPESWREAVCPQGGEIDRQMWEICLLEQTRQSLRSGNLHVPHSRTFQPVETYLLDREQWERERLVIAEEHGLPLAFKEHWPKLETLLKESLSVLDEAYPRDERLEIRDDQFHVTRLEKLAQPPSAREMRKRVQQIVSKRQLTDLLLELHGWTGFLKAFTRITTGRPITEADIAEQIRLLACLIAEGCNIGLAGMETNSFGLLADQLAEVKFSYIREETLARATAMLVNFQMQQPLAEHWGQGQSSSSDARVYGVPVRALNATYHPRYFASAGRGVAIYTHVSDLWIPFYTQVITCHARQASFVLDGLLYHGTRLEPKEHYTDTHGFTECLFSLAHVLGIRFCPRIKDLPEQRLWRPDDGTRYQNIEPVFAGKLKMNVIRESWDEIIRLIASVKRGDVRASLIVSKISAAARSSRLFRGLQEMGRLLKTAYLAEYLCNEELRRRVLLGLNKMESLHSLANDVHFSKQGELRDRTYEDQLNAASSLNLLLAAIVCWNTIHIQACLKKLRADGYQVNDEDLRFLSPLSRKHLGLYGRYEFDLKRLEELPPLEQFNY
jgi:TnpA family transposase